MPLIPPPPLKNALAQTDGFTTPTWARWFQLLWQYLRDSIADITEGAVALSDSTPNAVGTPAAGVGAEAARWDHVHSHGTQAGGALHAVVGVAAGFMSPADKTKLDGIATGATVGVTTIGAISGTSTPNGLDISGTTLTAHLADTSNPGMMSSSDKTKLDGIAAGAAALTSSAPETVGTTNTVGVATTAARADHVHAHGAQSDGTLHAAASGVLAGFVSLGNQTLGTGTKTVEKLVVSDTTGNTVVVGGSDFIIDGTNHNAGVGTTDPGSGYAIAGDVSFEMKRNGASFGLISTENTGGTSDAGLGFTTATANEDAFILLDHSDARKLKFCTGNMDSDASRNTSTRLYIEQGGTVNVTGALKVAGSTGLGHTSTPQYPADFGAVLANTLLAIYNNVPAGGSSVAGIGVQSGDFRFHQESSGSKFSWRPSAAGAALMELSGAGVLNVVAPSGITIGGVVVPTISSTSTLTNKTLTSPTITSPTITYRAAANSAFAGGGQASATAITTEVSFVTVAASAGDSVKLPTAALGAHVVVFNLTAVSVNVFPASGAAIDDLGTNAAYALAAGVSREFWGRSTTAWRSR